VICNDQSERFAALFVCVLVWDCQVLVVLALFRANTLMTIIVSVYFDCSTVSLPQLFISFRILVSLVLLAAVDLKEWWMSFVSP